MPAKVLSVDDSKTIPMIVKRTFATYEATVLEAANDEEGLAAAAENPELIVLDITMPVIDGGIMLTAESGRENVAFIAKLGVRDYLVKPFKDEQLVEKVSRVVTLTPKAVAA